MNILGFGWRDHEKEREAMAKKSEYLAKEKLRDNALELLSYLILETDSVCFPYKFPFERKAKALLGKADLQTMVKNLGFEDYGGLREHLGGILKKSTSIEQTMKQVKDSISLDKIVIERQEEVKKPMAASREFMLERMIKMKQKTGFISEDAIKKDPLLSLYEVQREFGSVEKAKKIIRAMAKEGSSQEKVPSKKETIKNSGDFKEIMKATIKKKQEADSAAAAEPKQQRVENATVDSKSKSEPKIRTEDAREKGGKQMSKTKEFSYEDVYSVVAELAKSSGKIPTEAQIREQSKMSANFPSAMTVRKYLGDDWRKKMAKELGLAFGEKIVPKPKETGLKKATKSTAKVSVADDATKANSSNEKTAPEKELSKDWIAELNHEYGIKIDKVVKNREEATTIISEALAAIASAASAFSEFEASKMLQYDMEGGGTTMIYILSSK